MGPKPTIFALSSAPGRAGVAVIRVSGPAAGRVIETMAPPLPRPRLASGRRLHHPLSGEALDQALMLWFPAPRSFTGEDVAELHVHGGRAVIAAVLGALAAVPGCRLAEAGEFARRAFENGKLDLAEVEGIADLIDAETEAQRRQALAQAGGALSRLTESWRAAMLDAMALAEAAIDFSDEGDVAADALSRAKDRVAALQADVRRHLDDGHRGEILRDGFRVVLAGPPNVGKSSLLNALARREVAIVSEEAGTTRDVIELRLDLEGLAVVVSDTAGLREAGGAVEREGIRRTVATARDADLVIWLMDAHAPVTELPPDLAPRAADTLMVLNKADLLPGGAAPATLPDDLMAISARTGAGINALAARIAAIARDRTCSASGRIQEPAVVTQARHREHLETASHHLGAFLAGPLEDAELRAEDLRLAAAALGRITGRVDPEDVLERIFARFCIGK